MGDEEEDLGSVDFSQLEEGFQRALREDAQAKQDAQATLDDLPGAEEFLEKLFKVQRKTRWLIRLHNAVSLLTSTLVLIAVVVVLVYAAFPHFPVWKTAALAFAGRVMISGSPFGTGVTYIAHVSELARRRRR